MVEEAAETGRSNAARDVKAELDERRVARAVAIGLPVVTAGAALVVGVVLGAAMAILVIAAGTLLGVIALFWASLRVLSGDAALSPELEALDATAHAVDALASRKQMLIRALKDLDNERALGKLEDDDYEQLSTTYRGELKEVMKRIDASLERHRPKAEDAARLYLQRSVVVEKGSREAPPPAASAPEIDDDDDDDVKPVATAEPISSSASVKSTRTSNDSARVECAACATSNEVDASFCKKCGASLAKDASQTDADRKATAKESADEA